MGATSPGLFFAYRAKKPLHAGVRMFMVPWLSESVCPSVCVCVSFVVFTHCESGSRRISITPESGEAREHGLTRGTCSVTRREEVAAVAELLWNYWCVLGAAGFRVYLFVFSFRTHTA